MTPAYLDRLSVRDLKERADQLRDLLQECILCPRECRAERLNGKHGVCRSTDTALVSSFGAHFGEEPPLVGHHGSGTIFFSSCNLKCLFCQNYDISHKRIGEPVTTAKLASTMLHLQEMGCHNINLVTPTHVAPQIAAALVLAVDQGLRLPIVYNCGGYESVRTLKLLDGIIDIYMPDIKYSSDEVARRYSGAPGYWTIVRKAIEEMHRQVGDLQLDGRGIATRGLLIRHLVLPNGLAGSETVIDFIANEVSLNSYLNIMDQYRPCFHASQIPALNRRTTDREYSDVVRQAHRVGLRRGFDVVLETIAN